MWPCCAATSFHVCQCVPIASKPCFVVAAIDSRPVPYLPAALAPVGEIDAATATSRFGSLYGLQLQARVLQREPVGLRRDGLAAEQRHDHVERLVHARALHVGGDAEHVRVGRELARARSRASRGRG